MEIRPFKITIKNNIFYLCGSQGYVITYPFIDMPITPDNLEHLFPDYHVELTEIFKRYGMGGKNSKHNISDLQELNELVYQFYDKQNFIFKLTSSPEIINYVSLILNDVV